MLDIPELAPTREIADGVFWLGGCKEIRYQGQVVHSYGSVFLVVGDERTLLVDTGHPKDWERLAEQLDRVLAHCGRATVDYLFPTHAEVAHAANLGRLLDRYPSAVVVGDTRDYHLLWPEHTDRLRPAAVGERLDLGGSEFVFVEAVLRDLLNTQWGYDTGRRVLFVADGFAYMHHHAAGECGRTTEELADPPLEEFTAAFAEYALYWTRYVDVAPHCERVDRLLTELPTDVIAPAHGGVITDVERTVPRIYRGLALEGQLRD